MLIRPNSAGLLMFEAVLNVKPPTFCPLALPRRHRDSYVLVRALKKKGERLSHLALVSDSRPFTIPNKTLQRYSLKPVKPYQVDAKSRLVMFETPICPLYEALCDTACLLIHETSHRGGAYWTVGAESRSDVRYLLKRMHDYGVEAAVDEVHRMDGRRVLTSRQGEALYTAYQKGYFDYPHRISLRELARQLGCSAPTLSILLRRGVRKIMEDFIMRQVVSK
jgi:predicted DNA binding protein